jgi:hypothetical protein
MNKSTRALALMFTIVALAACGHKKKDAPAADVKAKPGPTKPTVFEFSATSEVVGKDDSINLSVNIPNADKSAVDTFTLTIGYGPTEGSNYVSMKGSEDNKDLAAGISSLGTTDQVYAVFAFNPSKLNDGGTVYLLVKDGAGLVLSDTVKVGQDMTASEVLKRIQDKVTELGNGKTVKDIIVQKSWKPSVNEGGPGFRD